MTLSSPWFSVRLKRASRESSLNRGSRWTSGDTKWNQFVGLKRAGGDNGGWLVSDSARAAQLKFGRLLLR